MTVINIGRCCTSPNLRHVLPEVVFRYQPNEDINIFAALKTGCNSGGGGNNIRPTGAIVPGLNS
ncbi:MAG: hypothetical protein AAGE37_11210 [Pseudomonadota bacterium]